MMHITALRFVEREVQSEANPSLRRMAKILQQEVTHTFTDGAGYSRWEDVPLVNEPTDQATKEKA